MKPNILVVDDEPEIRNLVRELLTDVAILTEATDSLDALNQFLEIKHDIVITDIRMPGQSGIDLLRELRSLKDDVLVVMITAFGEKELAIQALNNGAFEFLEKPIDHAKITGVIERASNAIAEAREQREKVSVMEKYLDYGTLSASILHDATNLITILNGRIYRLKKQLNEHKVKAEIVDSVEGLNKILKMLGTLATSAKPFLNSTNQQSVGSVSVQKLIEQTTEYLEYKIEKSQVTVTKSCSNDLNIYCDPLQITRVLMNLITNSIQAMTSTETNDPRKIDIVAENVDGNAIIRVQDNGPGVPEDKQEKIFDDFYSTKTGLDTSGLGLGICRKICESYGGSLQLTDSSGGATFVISIPSLT